ncbi:hypothetical protein AVEN_111730-1 [Araneus ventricosus]|uniref:Uncharacterized protein n=1 Tax=Araneus ventricosus TaxID=182803 RepID=A0A4Y2C8L5_ARAVE|nr:hypothetical protein AVEN_111730-1 [Araneus ventricosus]
MPAVVVVSEGESEFPLSLIEKLGRSRILRSLYFNGLRNQRVKPIPSAIRGQMWMRRARKSQSPRHRMLTDQLFSPQETRTDIGGSLVATNNDINTLSSENKEFNGFY